MELSQVSEVITVNGDNAINAMINEGWEILDIKVCTGNRKLFNDLEIVTEVVAVMGK